MSLDIDYCSKCETKEEIVKKSQELHGWMETITEEKWNPMSYGNKEFKVFDKPADGGKQYLMSRTIFKANAQKIYEYIQTASLQQQQEYDDIVEFERDQTFPEGFWQILLIPEKHPVPAHPWFHEKSEST